MAISLSNSAFQEGEMIPAKYACDGKDVSVTLKWTGAPEGTKSFALISDDPDAPVGTWVHWIMWNILPAVCELPEGDHAWKQLSRLADLVHNFYISLDGRWMAYCYVEWG